MGGRGRSSGVAQINIEESIKEAEFMKNIEERRLKVKEKIKKQENGLGSGGGINFEKIFKRCACCSNYSLHIGTEDEKCPVCGWIDDEYQNSNTDSIKGKNKLSLNENKKQYFKSKK